MRRLTVAIRRRESVAVAARGLRRLPAPPAARPSRRRGSKARRRRAGARAAPGLRGGAEFWETEILPRRVAAIVRLARRAAGGGSWLWRAARDGRDEPRSRFVPRDFAGAGRATAEPGELAPKTRPEPSKRWARRAPASRPTWPGPRAWSRPGCAVRSGELMLRGPGDERPLRSRCVRGPVEHARRALTEASADPAAWRVRGRAATRPAPRDDGRSLERPRRGRGVAAAGLDRASCSTVTGSLSRELVRARSLGARVGRAGSPAGPGRAARRAPPRLLRRGALRRPVRHRGGRRRARPARGLVLAGHRRRPARRRRSGQPLRQRVLPRHPPARRRHGPAEPASRAITWSCATAVPC